MSVKSNVTIAAPRCAAPLRCGSDPSVLSDLALIARTASPSLFPWIVRAALVSIDSPVLRPQRSVTRGMQQRSSGRAALRSIQKHRGSMPGLEEPSVAIGASTLPRPSCNREQQTHTRTHKERAMSSETAEGAVSEFEGCGPRLCCAGSPLCLFFACLTSVGVECARWRMCSRAAACLPRVALWTRTICTLS